MSDDADPEAAQQDIPALNLPQLQTNLSESDIKDLAYLVLAANCNQQAECALALQLTASWQWAAAVGRGLLMTVHALQMTETPCNMMQGEVPNMK